MAQDCSANFTSCSILQKGPLPASKPSTCNPVPAPEPLGASLASNAVWGFECSIGRAMQASPPPLLIHYGTFATPSITIPKGPIAPADHLVWIVVSGDKDFSKSQGHGQGLHLTGNNEMIQLMSTQEQETFPCPPKIGRIFKCHFLKFCIDWQHSVSKVTIKTYKICTHENRKSTQNK